ncbi:MAG: HEAT repeat domain-containing protein [Planctomycetota bacterium]
MARLALLRSVATALAVCTVTALLPAHGGQFRGGGPTPGPPTPIGGPAGPGGGGPSTGGRPNISDGTSWQVWWEFNKDELMANCPPLPTGTVSGSDEFYLGARRQPGTRRDVQAPTETDRRDRIASALARTLQAESHRDIVTSCLIGLGKVGLDPDGLRLEQLFEPHLAASDQEVRETAALAFGIAGRQGGYPTLVGLLRDDEDGRRLCGKDAVPDRTRTFSAWSLGLLAARSRDPALKRAVRDLLLNRLQDESDRDRDLRVALVHGLGLLTPAGARTAGEKLLLWQVVEELWRFYGLDLGKGAMLVQAHVPGAIARLLGPGDSVGHQRAKQLLVADLFADRRSNEIRQSAALALGRLCLPREQLPADAEPAEALLKCYQRGVDQQSRFFAVLALGRIGGAANRSALLGVYLDANKATERPWVALALGLIGQEHLRREGAVDAEIADLLLRDLQDLENDNTQSALALSLGLCGHTGATTALRALLADNQRRDTMAGYLCTALAMLGDVDSADMLVDLMRTSVRRPFLLQQCAQALGRLGDARTVPVLLEMLDQSQSTAALSAVAMALASIRDRRCIDPLIAALGDSSRPDLARAFAAAALAGVGDKEALPWNAVIAADVNYKASVSTLMNGSNGVLDIL